MMKISRILALTLLLAVWLTIAPVPVSAAEPGGLTPPQLTYFPPVVFSQPVSDAYAGQKLQILLRVSLNEQGTVADGGVSVIESAGNADVDQAVIDAMRTAVFSPAQRDGQAVAITIRLPLQVTVPEKQPEPAAPAAG